MRWMTETMRQDREAGSARKEGGVSEDMSEEKDILNDGDRTREMSEVGPPTGKKKNGHRRAADQ